LCGRENDHDELRGGEAKPKPRVPDGAPKRMPALYGWAFCFNPPPVTKIPGMVSSLVDLVL
jgi:hypothetical protein